MEKESNIGKKFWLLLLIPLAIYFFFGLQHISKFVTADEHFWMYNPTEGRIHDYWRAVGKGNWAATRINDKPGISLAYISGIGMLFEGDPDELIRKNTDVYEIYNPEKFEHVNLVFRLPILVFNGLLAIYFFWIIKKLTESDWIALFSAALILLNPVLIGISQIVNPDSLLWSFSFASFLSFLTYLKTEEKKYAVFSSFFLGWAMLSKYAAIIFILYFALVVALHFIFHSHEWTMEQLSVKVKKFIFSYLLIVLGALAIFSILMPAVFLDIKILYRSTIGYRQSSPVWIFGIFIAALSLILADAYFRKSKHVSFVLAKIRGLKAILPKILFSATSMMFLLVLLNWAFGDNVLDIKNIQFDAGKSYPFRRQDLYDQIFLEIYPLVFSLVPMVLFSLFYIWIKSIFKQVRHGEHIFILSLFLIIFYSAVLQQQLLVNIRYSVIIYPLLMLLAGISIVDFFSLEKFKRIPLPIVFALIVIFSSVSLFLIKPYYFNYTNDLLPKERIITGAWGYGGYEAAQYLNAMPNAENLVAWSDYWGFCPFFKGKCLRLSGLKNSKLGNDIEKIDYYIITRRGTLANKDLWERAKATMEEKPVKRIEIDGRPKNFITIYKTDRNILDLKK